MVGNRLAVKVFVTLVMRRRLENVEPGAGEEFAIEMELVGVAAQAHVPVHGAENVSADAKVVIVFNLNIWDAAIYYEFKELQLKRTPRGAVYYDQGSIRDSRANRIKITQPIVRDLQPARAAGGNQLIEGEFGAATQGQARVVQEKYRFQMVEVNVCKRL